MVAVVGIEDVGEGNLPSLTKSIITIPPTLALFTSKAALHYFSMIFTSMSTPNTLASARSIMTDTFKIKISKSRTCL